MMYSRLGFLCGAAFFLVSFQGALAADQNLTGDGSWASAGTHQGADIGDASDAATGQTVDVNGHVLNIGQYPNVANDGEGVDQFTLGNVSDTAGTGALDIENSNTGATTINLSNVTTGNGANFGNYPGFGLLIFNSSGQALTINVNSIDTAGAFAFRGYGSGILHMIVDGDIAVTGGSSNLYGFGNYPTILEMRGNATFTNGLYLFTAQSVALFSGTENRTVTGIMAGGGEIDVSNTGLTNFASYIGPNIFRADAGTLDFQTDFDPGNLIFGGSATVNPAHNFGFAGAAPSSSAVDFNGYDGVFNFTDGSSIAASFEDSSGGGHGVLNFAGSSTVAGDLGVNGAGIGAVNFRGAGATVGVTGDVYANSITLSGSGSTVTVSGKSQVTDNLSLAPDTIFETGGALQLNGNASDRTDVYLARTAQLTTGGLDAGSGGLLTYEIDKTGGIIQNSVINVGGGPANLANASFAAVFDPESERLRNGDVIPVLTNSSAVTLPSSPTGDLSYLYHYTVSETAGTVDLTVQIPTVAAIADTLNHARSLIAVDSLPDNAGGNLGLAQASLASAPDRQSFDRTLDALEPTADDSARNAAASVLRSSANLIDQHLSDRRLNGVSSGDAAEGLGFWGQVFGDASNQDSGGGDNGYSSHTFGGAVGADSRNLLENGTVGLAFSYGDTLAHSRDATSTDTRVDSYQLALYGDQDLPYGFYSSGLVSYGWNTDRTTRHDVGGLDGLDAEGRFNANQVGAQAEIGHDYRVPMLGKAIVTPAVEADWTLFDPTSYTESGAGTADLHVNGKTANLMQAGPAVRAAWDIPISYGARLLPSASIGYRYSIVNDRIEDTSQFTGGGGVFETEAESPSRNSFDFGAAVKIVTSGQWSLSGNYNLDYRSDYINNAATLRATYRF